MKSMKRLWRKLSARPKVREPGGLKAHQLVHRIAAATDARRCFLLTAPTTGNRLLDNLSLSKFETLISAKYSPEVDIRNGAAGHQGLLGALSCMRKIGSFDIAFVDPYHSYEESSLAIRESISCLCDTGWMVLHDCFPPYRLTGDDYRAGDWCGSTYAAFRDAASSGDRAWFVVDSDYGLGVLGPKNSFPLVDDGIDAALASAWESASLEGKRELFAAHGHVLLRVIPEDRAEAVVSRLLLKQPVRLEP